MSIQTEITRISEARNTLRSKATELGIAKQTDKIDVLATAFDGIENRGAVDAQVREGESYTIPKGYHNGSGTVSGVAGGGNYKLQTKSVTPTTSQQNIAPDSGYYGLSAVTVNSIPSQYKDVSSTTATAPDVLANKVFISSEGKTTTGTMPNNGAVSKVLDTKQTSYTVPAGYHSGTGKVSIATETKSVSPTRSQQVIEPTDGKVLSQVTVGAISSDLQDVSGVTATAVNVLDGTFFVTSKGALTEGTMVNRGANNQTIDGLTTTSVTIPQGYHNGQGTVSLTNDIEASLVAI